MKCLILQGSPRSQGNTASLTGPFEEELRALGNECTAVRLYEKKILPCTACRRCQNDWSSFFCVQKDDMAEIREKMLAADVIVLASPIYFYTMTAQMEAGDIRKTDAPEQAYRVGKSL